MQLLEKLRIIYNLLDSVDRKKLALILCISLVNGAINAAGIASILPFIGLISEPEILERNKYILYFSQLTGIESYAAVVVSFGVISLSLLIVSNVLSSLETWYGVLFSASKTKVFSARLLNNYLDIDVLEFEKKPSAERAKEVLSDVYRVLISTLFATMGLISDALMALFVVGLLLWIDWAVTLVVFAVLILIHYMINFFTSKQLDALGKGYAKLQASLYNHALEALKLNKEIKMNSLAPYFVRRFSYTAGQMVGNSVKSSLISELPRRLLEVVAFSAILGVALYFAVFSGDGSQPVTIIGMYAVAAYRLIPAVASIFNRLERIWYDTAILEDVVGALKEQPAPPEDPNSEKGAAQTIAFRSVSFAYSDAGPFHLDGLNLEFPVGRFSCLRGKTGCGKTTVLNLLAGLYRPAKGFLACDGRPVNAYDSKRWKQRIGLVPATINIIQSSIYENIALGLELEQVDRNRVREVCRLVELDELVCGLPNGYESVYGDDGLRFSSGQILKVGIARALYRNPSLLLLDESTDAFDLKTETLVLDRLKAIEGLTIIFVSHRPSVMEHADLVIDLEAVL